MSKTATEEALAEIEGLIEDFGDNLSYTDVLAVLDKLYWKAWNRSKEVMFERFCKNLERMMS